MTAPDAEGLAGLVPAVYEELRRVARAQLRHEDAGHSLQATALVHEAYLRLLSVNRITVENRPHFLALAAPDFDKSVADRRIPSDATRMLSSARHRTGG